MPFKMITFDPEDEYQNNHPGSPPYYYDPCPSFSSSDSSPAVGFWNYCLGGISSGPVLPFAEPSHARQQFSSPVQVRVQQSRNRGRDGNNNFLLKLINRRRRQGSANKLVLFDGYSRAFDLEELLSASAELLGKGLHWTTYKVSLKDSTTVVVKRLKENGNVTMTELREHMELLGQIKHENVAPLRGYYISRDEILMLYDYFSQGSVYSMLHGKQRQFLGWEQRRRILIGAARGIAYVHKQNGGTLCLGSLTSWNVFINTQGYGCVSEFLCNTLKSGESPYSRLDKREATQASDIYGLGVLMLELLTDINPWMANEETNIFLKASGHLIDDARRFAHGLSREVCILALTCESYRRPKIEELVEKLENIFGESGDHEQLFIPMNETREMNYISST